MEHARNLSTAKIECRNVGKSFHSAHEVNEVLGDISFSVKENEFVVVFGPGQCGKTTLLKLIAGLDTASKGSILQNGEPISRPHYSRSMVYQTLNLFPWLTVRGNVEFGPKARGLSKAEYRPKAQKLIDLVGLHGFEKSYPIQLSGGMKQRVGIARAYCNEPDVLLMDEPFGHLDAQTRYMMQEELSKIWTENKTTVLFVTNNLEEAIFLGDRIILLSDCPATIQAEYQIDLPRPRNLVDPEFLKIRAKIAADMDVGNLMGGVHEE